MSRYRRSSIDPEWIMFGWMCIGLVVFVVGFVWFVASNEAKSYAKFCDQPVTTWDAVFLDLRIDECAKCDE